MTETTQQTAVPPAILPAKFPHDQVNYATKPCFVLAGGMVNDGGRGMNILQIDAVDIQARTYICAHADRAGILFAASAGIAATKYSKYDGTLIPRSELPKTAADR